MLYRNDKTGAVIDVQAELSGNWKKVEVKKPEKIAPKKKGAAKK